MSNYELTFILRPADETTLTAAQDRIAGQVQNAGGEIVARHDWGRRRLAYPIQKNKDGYYTTLYASLPGSAVRGIERAFKLNDQVLRYLFVRVEQFVLPQTPAPAPAPEARVETEAAPEAAAASEAAAETPAAPTEAPTEPVAETPAAETTTASAEGS